MAQSRFIQLQNTRLHYLEWEGGRPAALYIPGFIANAYGALGLAPAIAPAHSLFALDLKGRGQSDKPLAGYGIAEHVANLHEFCQSQGIEAPILLGHSFGAALALSYALQYPVTKIVLLDGGAPPSEAAFQLFLAYHQNLSYEYPSVEAYIAPYRQMQTLQPWTDIAEQFTRANVNEQADGRAFRSVPRHVVEAELEQLRLEDWQIDYAKIQAPVLLIRAGLGSFGPDDQHITDPILATMQARFPRLEVYNMPQAGHTSILSIPDPQRDQTLRDFLAS